MIRNAGGIVTDDVVRSLVLSHRLLGTKSLMIINHTDCGLQRLSQSCRRSVWCSMYGRPSQCARQVRRVQ